MTASNNHPPQSGAADDGQADIDARLEEWLASTTGPLNWRTVPSGEARGRWESLREWVNWFRLEFSYDHRVVPPCWYQHRALVSVLAALHDHWSAAYDSLNGAGGASEWHRALITLEARLRDWAARTGCTADTHRADLIAAYPDDSAAWRRHVLIDVNERTDREVADAMAKPDTRGD